MSSAIAASTLHKSTGFHPPFSSALCQGQKERRRGAPGRYPAAQCGAAVLERAKRIVDLLRLGPCSTPHAGPPRHAAFRCVLRQIADQAAWDPTLTTMGAFIAQGSSRFAVNPRARHMERIVGGVEEKGFFVVLHINLRFSVRHLASKAAVLNRAVAVTMPAQSRIDAETLGGEHRALFRRQLPRVVALMVPSVPVKG